jgi:hypothetical protein
VARTPRVRQTGIHRRIRSWKGENPFRILNS